MGKLQWYINRLRAMNVREVVWRLDQKRIEKQEASRFGGRKVNVGSEVFNASLAGLRFDPNALGICFAFNDNSLAGGYKTKTEKTVEASESACEFEIKSKLSSSAAQTASVSNADSVDDASEKNKKNISLDSCGWVPSVNTDIHLLKGADYEKWPDTFSYKLNYKQRDDLGDARSNWEKNRHFDWALLAKVYYVTGDEKYFVKLQNMVDDWMTKNPFLHGISWTSAMEFAIRSINWMYALAFLMKDRNDNDDDNDDDNDNWASLCGKLRNGIINITEYLTKHYSRFSSANNHLLVEATAIGLAGYAFGHKPWQELAVRILTEELPKQNYSDGVNKELSLHYQTFGMEAYLLLAHVMQKNNDSRWKQWVLMLQKETEFVAHSTWREKVVCEFGDDDEGKIIDLQGKPNDNDNDNFGFYQWEWVLQLASLVTGVRYSNFEEICENTLWFFSEEQIEYIKKASLYDTSKSRCFEIGGNSFLRDKEDRVLIGIDHAELGFGSIAAHGHADALSFQMLVDGEVVFADPGTYIYHCWLPERDKFRKTINHNTLCLMDNNKTFIDQSKMLGAFMWGDRANCTLDHYELTDEKDVLIASHDGYKPNVHRRAFCFDKVKHELTIEDSLTNEAAYAVTFLLGQSVVPIQKTDGDIELISSTAVIGMHVDGAERIAIEDAELSPEYGVKVPTKAIRVYGQSSTITTTITFK